MTMQEGLTKKRKYDRVPLFDFIRVIAVLMIIFVHIFQRYQLEYGYPFGINNFYWVSIGGLGVTLLVILSGAVLQYNYGDKKINYWQFVFRRIKRIYPVYWLSIFFTLVLFGFALAIDKTFWQLILDISGFLAFSGSEWINFILPTGWFIGLIVSLYFFYPLLKDLFEKYNITMILIILFIVEVISRYYIGKYFDGSAGSRPLDWFPLCRAFEFGLGIYVVSNKKLMSFISSIKTNIDKPVAYLSELSFAAYLIHYPIARLAEIASQNIMAYTVKLLVVTMVFSYAIYNLDKLIQKKINFRKDSLHYL